MTELLKEYAKVAGEDVVDHIRQLSAPLKDMKVVHINSTRLGGGVAEILTKLVPLMEEIGIDARWEVITGENKFFQCTKNMHNALQGTQISIQDSLLHIFEKTNEKNAEVLRPILEEADFVFIHDPQPAPLLKFCPNRKGKWVWRCHINVSHPNLTVWKYLRKYVSGYDASVFSLADFSKPLPHPQYIIPPSIDPLSEKNMELDENEIKSTHKRFNIDPLRPVMLQVSRYDRFKDPLGVIQAYRLTKAFTPNIQLILAGGGASDDPEGEIVLNELLSAVGDDPDIHILVLPPDSHLTINALQRLADIVLQKSIKEGFGLTVTEAMWKGKPVIGGDTGGIRLQVVNHQTGFRVSTPEGAALRIRYLLHHPEILSEMGQKAREFVRENFLITEQLRELLTLIIGLTYGAEDRIEL
ncbi:MAG: glycosyltransferase [Thermodesulfobacteriota bacterium]